MTLDAKDVSIPFFNVLFWGVDTHFLATCFFDGSIPSTSFKKVYFRLKEMGGSTEEDRKVWIPGNVQAKDVYTKVWLPQFPSKDGLKDDSKVEFL